MPQNPYSHKYEQLPLPVIVYDVAKLVVLYANTEAKLTLEKTIPEGALLQEILSVEPKTYEKLQTILHEPVGALFNLTVKTGLGNELALTVSSSVAAPHSDTDAGVLYLHGKAALQPSSDITTLQVQDLLTQISKNLYHSSDAEIIIQSMLSMAGNFINVDRVYVFEEHDGFFSNTYEWCSPHGVSRKNSKRAISVSSETWEAIEQDMFISNDLSDVPEGDRAYLKSQGVKSIAVLPLLRESLAPMGFIGFEQQQRQRIWRHEEIQLLQIVAGIVVQLLLRKYAVQASEEYQKIIQTVLDNVESPIYVSEFGTNKILFTNKRLRAIISKSPDDLLQGKICWQTLQKEQDGPCPFCPMPQSHDNDGNLAEPKRWEFKNPFDSRWYLMRNFAINWVDQSYVHMSIATEITELKEKEANLREFASKDKMTGIFNREWGHVLVKDAVNEVRGGGAKSSICFFDLDGLKLANDNYGHKSGDELLIAFVNVVKEFTRRSDIFCRWGGDEFLLLLSDCMEANAEKVIAKIKGKLEQLNKNKTFPFPISFSYGIKEVTQGDKADLDILISEADRLMYADKMKKRRASNSTQ